MNLIIVDVRTFAVGLGILLVVLLTIYVLSYLDALHVSQHQSSYGSFAIPSWISIAQTVGTVPILAEALKQREPIYFKILQDR